VQRSHLRVALEEPVRSGLVLDSHEHAAFFVVVVEARERALQLGQSFPLGFARAPFARVKASRTPRRKNVVVSR
jgi:hypothetical protein